MTEPTSADGVKELHRDLARKWRTHGPRLEQIWRSLGQGQRAKAMKAGAMDGVVLKHSLDASLGNVCKFMPEWNLRDVTAPGSDHLLEILKHRAITTLEEQYLSGANSRTGDHELIMNMMRTRNLQHVDSFRDCYTFFMEGERYGQSFKLLKEKEQTLAAFQPSIDAGLCIPQSAGELILTRQIYMLQCLNIVVEDILEAGSTTRNQKQPPKKSTDAAAAALSKLSIQPSPPKLDLADLHNSAKDQKATLEDNLNLVCTEPVVLAHAVNIWFFSRPELVADEKGRMLPAHTDKYISAAFFEAVHSAVKGPAIWDYMCRLLELLKSSTDKSHREIILQEVSNLCHLEYSRVQALLKRHVASGTGLKWFKRVSNVYDNGNVRVSMKGKPESLIRDNPQLLYLLRLCQPETNASKAIDWIKKLDDHHTAHPSDREDLQDREVDALCDLAVIVGFIHSLSPVISMPAFNRKRGQLFVAKSGELEGELNQLKTQVDLADFAVPIDHLREPGMSEGALEAIDQFVVEKTGTKMGFLYQDLIEECMLQLQDRLKAKTEQQDKAKEQDKATEFVPLPSDGPQKPEVRVQQRREKEKTRPKYSSVYEITPSAQKSSELESLETTQAPPSLKVKPSTAEVFSTLFSKSESRGSVSWSGFVAAMADLGFSVLPKFGSVYTFFPPEGSAVQRPVTLHRPHKSRIEGYLLLIFGRRLQRLYGWAKESFQAA
ncbi:Uu.00g098250.m01.CDS01 [Anthostomella pinea]|uniref:Uu.00g098250.m01.CDS01 n=1 Tax=Anthostomella pinea TaxID=933095 RepID=A0AAI8VCM5_9PEZI|nr:Uu.00g098250.m01.CDS01 [Anthostomella pinea]